MSQEQLEKDNEAVVNAMVAAWEAQDLDGIRATLADDIVFQMNESVDDVTGADAVCKSFEPVLSAERVEWEVSRSHAIGSLVINERIDKFYGLPDGKGGTIDVIAPVAGFFYIKDGKIVMWRDYSIPGRAHSYFYLELQLSTEHYSGLSRSVLNFSERRLRSSYYATC